MNYGELVAAIQNYCQNSDSLFTGQIDDFIRTSEARVYRSVQMPVNYLHTTTATAAGAGPGIVLPNGFVEVTGVRFSSVAAAVAGPWEYLLRKEYDFLREAYPGGASIDTAVPRYYAVKSAQVDSGSDVQEITIVVAPTPDVATYKFSVDGYGFNGDSGFENSITVVPSAGNETWLSVTFPDVLLNGALIDAFVFMKTDPGVVQHYEQLFHEGLATMASTVTGEQVDVSVGGPGPMPAPPGGMGGMQ